MQAAGIVEALNVSEQIPSRLGPGGIEAMVDPLGFQGVEELFIGALSQQSPLRLMDGVMPAVASAPR